MLGWFLSADYLGFSGSMEDITTDKHQVSVTSVSLW